MAKHICERCWISFILRLSIACLFTAAAVPKFAGGNPGSLVAAFEGMFKDTWLPMPLVKLHATFVPYIEALIPVWLLVGFRLRLGWVVTALFMLSLAFGTLVMKQDAGHNFFYVMVCLAGLYFSQFDKYSVDSPATKGS